MSEVIKNLESSLSASGADLVSAIDLVELYLEVEALDLLFQIAADDVNPDNIKSRAIRAAQFIDRSGFDEILNKRSGELPERLLKIARSSTKDDYF